MLSNNEIIHILKIEAARVEKMVKLCKIMHIHHSLTGILKFQISSVYNLKEAARFNRIM
jgi:hypothetical protein